MSRLLRRLGRTIPAERPGTMDDEYLIPVEADFLTSNIVQLAVNETERADDEANRNKKLKDHQATTEPGCVSLKPAGHLSFQYIEPAERKKDKRRGSCPRECRPEIPGG